METRSFGKIAFHLVELNIAAITEPDEARGFARGVAVEHACEHERLVGDDADGLAAHAREAGDDVFLERYLSFVSSEASRRSSADTCGLVLKFQWRSQAVRLPKELRLAGTECRVRREGQAVILEPLELDVTAWRTELDRLVALHGDFLPDGEPSDAPMPVDDSDWDTAFAEQASGAKT